LDAWCHAAQGRRLFRLDRIDRVDVLAEPRIRPDEPPRELGDDLFEGSPDDEVATLHLRPRARWVADYYPVETVTEAADGGLDVSLRVGDPRWLVRLVLGLAPDAIVLSPQEYADEVTARARAALDLYEAPVDRADDATA
jgi:proteasome accessory factor C